MSRPIPIKNLYHLLCYAWDVLPQAELIDVEFNDEDHPLDLLAEVLIKGVNHLMRRGVDQDYRVANEITSTLKGRIDFPYSARRFLLHQGKAHCSFDEMTADILQNQIVKTTFLKLSRTWGLQKQHRRQCGNLSKRLGNVQATNLSSRIFSEVRLHRNNRFYRFLINVCELIYQETLISEGAGDTRFRNFFRDEGKMPRLYEKFIFNFYVKKQDEFKVTSEKILWDATSSDDPELLLLPTMRTDVSLRSKDKTIILDAKYYQETLKQFHGKSRIHSSNLYQMFSYLKNIEKNGNNDKSASAVLLYPVTHEEISVEYELGGKSISINTVNLAADWSEIENKLLSIILNPMLENQN